jgi:hypothetical protein
VTRAEVCLTVAGALVVVSSWFLVTKDGPKVDPLRYGDIELCNGRKPPYPFNPGFTRPRIPQKVVDNP